MPKDRIPELRKHGRRAYASFNGKRRYFGRWGTTRSRETFDKVLAAWLDGGRVAPPEPADDQPLLLTTLLTRYMTFAKGYYRNREGQPSSEIHALRVLVNGLADQYPDVLASEFGPLRLKAFRAHLVAKGNSRGYVNNQVYRIKRIFLWAVAEELLEPAVAQALQAVRGLRAGKCDAREGQRRTAVSEADFLATLPHVRPPVRAVLELLWWTGARPSEILTLRTSDVDRSGKVWAYVPRAHKTESKGLERRIFLGPRAQAVLLPWLRLDRQAFCFRPADAVEDLSRTRREGRQTKLWPSHVEAKQLEAAVRKGQGRTLKLAPRYDQNSLRQAVARACTAAGVPKWTPYQLRHAAATRIQRELGIELARVILGHTSANMTDVYVEKDFELARDGAERIG